MTYEELKNEIDKAIVNKPKEWRNGQFVFNYIDAQYQVARYVQFQSHIDCFYLDDKIDDFIKESVEWINKFQKSK